jgi:hypothetical protein
MGMSGWKDLLNSNAIQPVQQFAYTKGKNSTDSALIIDAMDILHGDLVDAFCIVSSDSDYTRLATRLRESGHFVMGVGEKKTPDAFVKACDRFIYVENLDVQEPVVGAARIHRSRREDRGKALLRSRQGSGDKTLREWGPDAQTAQGLRHRQG